MIDIIEFDHSFHERRLHGNCHDSAERMEQEATLRDLRFCFRNRRCALLTFASGRRYAQHQKNLTASAAASGEFQVIESWNFDRLSRTPFFADNRDILLRPRGQGYWLWKPYLISKMLDSSADGDLIIYNDCLPEEGNVFDISIWPMLAWLDGGDRRFAIARKPAANRSWTKRDCFHYMECDTSHYWDAEQIIATYMAFVVGRNTRALIADWLHYCRDTRVLTDDPNTCGLDNFAEFQDHRHDQSVLSNLLIRDRFDLPPIRFGETVHSKHLRDMLAYFRDALVAARLKDGCISVGKPWMQSSASVWSPAEGAMAVDAGRDFFFHTDLEDEPWWRLDLENLYQVRRIEIVNRPAPAFAWRANRLQVYVGPALEQLDLVFDAVSAGWDALTPIVLSLQGRTIRYVKISVDHRAFLHLKDVKVFGEEIRIDG